jgi:hypothetical protein
VMGGVIGCIALAWINYSFIGELELLLISGVGVEFLYDKCNFRAYHQPTQFRYEHHFFFTSTELYEKGVCEYSFSIALSKR